MCDIYAIHVALSRLTRSLVGQLKTQQWLINNTEPMFRQHQGEVLTGMASVRKGITTITVGVRLEKLVGRTRFLGIKFEQAPVFQFAPETMELDRSPRQALRAFDAHAIDGVGYAEGVQFEQAARLLAAEPPGTKATRIEARVTLRRYGVLFTKFEGSELTSDWRHGLKIAVALACLCAAGEREAVGQVEMFGWERVT